MTLKIGQGFFKGCRTLLVHDTVHTVTRNGVTHTVIRVTQEEFNKQAEEAFQRQVESLGNKHLEKR